ncbi:MAG: DUF2723 domain-containing protein, partial [Bacteroidota bacterium]
MNYSRINNLVGWGVFGIALVVYLLTMAPTASYWDCGEFIACANELEVPHPPGAPFFLLLGRIFAMLAFSPENVAFMLNIMSVLSASFTVLFTFWITTHLGRKLLMEQEGEPNMAQTIAIMGAGLVAGLANTFADSFWFNAVEAEVYALSSFFTAIVVWLAFKWESRADQQGNERWLILIAYLMGLSIGVHLLNLLAIPAIAFIYYFRKYEFSWRGFIVTGLISVAILGIIQTGIIIKTFDLAWAFEKALVGTQYANGVSKSGLGLPIGTGLVLAFVLLFGAIIGGIIYSIRRKNLALNTALLMTSVIFIGFASYLMIPIRSQANPPIDENNPEDSQTFISYMKREQYGNRPLFRGPLYNAQPVRLEEVGTEYVLEEGADKYTELGPKRQYEYADRDMKLFPRMYDAARPASWNPDYGPWTYQNFVKRSGKPNTPTDDRPTGGEDLKFFFSYQVVHMYWRYFMWNFAGRGGDAQDSGWESGLEFSKFAAMPDFMKDAPARNHFFMLPFLLGLLGLSWHASRRGKDATVIGLLFFFTGLAIIIYLNQYPNQPRERDYSFAGSFQTFAIWVGLGTIALYQLMERYLKGAAAWIATGIAIIGPLLMGAQGWDDHSRAGRYIAPESAYNLLNSCAKNAVLFTNGDNDTFPLWYLQEVEGVRTDVRVLCLSYVNTDWYIDQMKRQVNQSPPLPITLPRKDYVGQAKQSRRVGSRATLDIELPANGNQLLDQGIIYEEDLPYVQAPMKWAAKTRGGQGNRYLELKDILIINLLENVARGGWDRPVYFANTVTPSSFIGLDDYLRLEGLAYRIVPVMRPKVNDPYDPFQGNLDLPRMYDNMVNTFKYTNLDLENVYYDENVMRMLSNYHNTFYRLANGYLKEVSRLEQESSQLRSLIAAGEVDTDSANAIIANNQQTADELKAQGVEVMNFTEEQFPYQVATPDPYLIVRAGIMFDRLGESETAKEYFDFASDRAIGTLQYYTDTGEPFSR